MSTCEEESKLEAILLESPISIIARNDRERVCGTCRLWTADELNRANRAPYEAPVPTFAPLSWQAGSLPPADQKSYNTRLEQMYPELTDMLPMDNVVLAGASAGSVFVSQGQDGAFADLYIIGIPATEKGRLWAKVNEVAVKIRSAIKARTAKDRLEYEEKVRIPMSENRAGSSSVIEDDSAAGTVTITTSASSGIPAAPETPVASEPETAHTDATVERRACGCLQPCVQAPPADSLAEEKAQLASNLALLTPEELAEVLGENNWSPALQTILPEEVKMRFADTTTIETLRPGALTISGGRHGLKYRIILRPFESLSVLLHAFSLATACVAFDGVCTRLTAFGTYGYAHRVNIAWPAYETETYNANLWADFERRGFALAMPHLGPEDFKNLDQKTVSFSHFTFSFDQVGGNFATGKLALLNPNLPFDDYVETDSARLDCVEFTFEPSRMANQLNLLNLSAGRGVYVIADMGLNIATYITEPEPKFEDLLPRAVFETVLMEMLKIIMSGQNIRLATSIMTEVLQMRPDDIGRFMSMWIKTAQQHPGKELNAAPAFAPFLIALNTKYEAACGRPIDWWLGGDTAHRRNAPAASPQEWYGPSITLGLGHSDINPVTVVIQTLRRLLAHRAAVTDGEVFSNECSLCQQEVRRGAADTLILSCGHAYHWSSKSCPGFHRWSGAHDSCPVCRQKFDGPQNVPDNPVDIVVDWNSANN